MERLGEGRGTCEEQKSAIGHQGGRPLISRRGDHTRNLLGREVLAGSFLVLAAQAGTRGSLSVGAEGVVVTMQVVWSERGHIVCASPVLSCLVAVGVEPGVLLGVSQSLAKLSVVKRYEVFGSSCVRVGWGVGVLEPFPSPSVRGLGQGQGSGGGPCAWGPALVVVQGWRLTHDVTGHELKP